MLMRKRALWRDRLGNQVLVAGERDLLQLLVEKFLHEALAFEDGCRKNHAEAYNQDFK